MNRFYTFLISTILILCVDISNSYAQDLLVPQPYSIELEDSAEMGIPEAQYKMGKHYYQLYDMLISGLTSKDEARTNRKIASEWFKKAVSKGHVDAMYGLSQCYYDLYDGALSDSLYLWLEKAAASNNADAQYDLYVLYGNGKTSIKKDKKKSEQFFHQALRNGSIEANKRMYYRSKNDADRIKYVRLMAEKHDLYGLMKLAEAYSKGIGIAKNPQKALDIWNNLINDSYKQVKESLKNEVNDQLKDYYFSIGDLSKGFEYQAKLASTGYGSNSYSLSQKSKTDPVAQYWEASLYCKDPSIFGLEKSVYGPDIKKCETYLLQSAQQGYAPAMGKLAYCFLELDGGQGLGGPNKAYEWALKGAEKNDAWAQYVLAQCYLFGYGGCKKDTELAAKYLTKAADGNLSQALVLLASFYETGRYVDNNPGKAIELYEKAAQQGHVNAINRLGDLYEKQGDYEKSYQQFLLLANRKDPYSIFRLGVLDVFYRKSSGSTDANYLVDKGLRLIHKADDMGNLNAPYYLGYFYHTGSFYSKDINKAIQYYEKSAERGFPYASSELAHLYYEGKEVPRNYDSAFKYAKAAAEDKGFVVTKAMRLLSACYRAGLGTKRDDAKAKYWLEQAAKNKDTDALEILNVKVE